ncbi:hypothetical protein ABQ333_24540 [Serratia fonticola]|uniref:MrpH family fimbial adhesin n=1 Tax=Serratia fonticola TaxID=47917 RepID=UPI0015C6775D|nr:hypothetical protein [Serratia fonticola]NYA45345.1 hypothetical protein [Serratia fonticola]
MKFIGTVLLKKNAVIIGLLLLFLSHPVASAIREEIVWSNQNGQILIEKATYKQATFNMAMCSTVPRLTECRMFFAPSNGNGQPAAGSGITIASSPSLTDTQYAAALATFNGKLLALPADRGLCIWRYERDRSGANVIMEGYNCGSGGTGILPSVPVVPKCSAIGGPVEIAYGDIQASAAPGLKKTADLLVRCDANVTIKVTVSGLSTSTGIMLRSDGSLTADVLVRDQLANVGSLEKMTANLSVAVPISSVLKVNGELAGGAFRGSAIINMDIL